MKAMIPNILDVCLHKAGFRNENNPAMIAGLFNEFHTYGTQEFGEYCQFTLAVQKRTLIELIRSERSSVYLWDGSAGSTADRSLFFVEFSDSTIELVAPDYESGSNYAYSETIREAGETISECIARMNKKVKRVVHIIWDYSEWNELERFRSVFIYS